ncbi:hypothetical protein KDK_13810 [Dictyobacter kobayashii]|uniref:Uncharacterized protein n=1 Tax=Dictyobacter kobayashii TaxID=2014872 RepID=A0A402AEQ8_9CHLR|nr:hypothetical protein KDK_13810 [Dictyobacter kobayashii]
MWKNKWYYLWLIGALILFMGVMVECYEAMVTEHNRVVYHFSFAAYCACMGAYQLAMFIRSHKAHK